MQDQEMLIRVVLAAHEARTAGFEQTSQALENIIGLLSEMDFSPPQIATVRSPTSLNTIETY